jgi:hypothetical protein
VLVATAWGLPATVAIVAAVCAPIGVEIARRQGSEFLGVLSAGLFVALLVLASLVLAFICSEEIAERCDRLSDVEGLLVVGVCLGVGSGVLFSRAPGWASICALCASATTILAMALYLAASSLPPGFPGTG